MASGQFAVVYRQIGRLFQSGSVAGLSEGQLLDRYVARRDDAAFEAIVARHGSMVLGVCRAILHDPNDVDDAFQATFLVLVKKAGTLAHRDLLGNWLYGVAHRVARRARIDAARRRDRESTGPEPAESGSVDFDRLDVRPIIHDEVNRLPESYRAAVVLCYLEGQTHEEAARQLGWPVGTVKGRLARAKEILRARLTRRGLAIPSSTLLVTLAKDGQAAVTPTLIESTTTAAIAVATTPLATLASLSIHALSPHAIALTQGVLQTMSTAKLKLAATVLVAGMLSASGVSAYQNSDPNTWKPGAEIKPSSVPNAVPSSALSRAQARLKIAEAGLATVRQLPNADASLLGYWMAEVDRTEDLIEHLRVAKEGPIYFVDKAALKVQAAKRHEGEATVRAKSGQAADKLALLGAQLARLDAEAELEIERKKYNIPAQGPPKPPTPPETKAAETAPSAPAIPSNAIAASYGPPLNRDRKQHPADVDRNRRIEAALEKVVAMRFPQETSLKDVLKYIRERTKDDKGRTIPIYIDPRAENEAEKTALGVIDRPVSIDIDELPLRTTLRLVLKQAGLEYRIRDGLLFISTPDLFNEEDNPAPRQQPQPENARFQ